MTFDCLSEALIQSTALKTVGGYYRAVENSSILLSDHYFYQFFRTTYDYVSKNCNAATIYTYQSVN